MKKLLFTLLFLTLGAAWGGALEDSFAGFENIIERKDYATALKLLRPLAEQGNASAQSNLGWMYESGHGVTKDDKEAIRWYRLAADQGDADAQFNLGTMYGKGHGVTQDYKEAIRWYRLAADQGIASAQYNLGQMYGKGHGVTQDYKEAVRLWRLAAEQGHAKAQYNLGWAYNKGEGVTQDYKEAIRWYRLSADQGNASAQYNLGQYWYGRGQEVTQDYKEAIRWYRLAADQGNASAQYNLGLMYVEGQGVTQDHKEAVRLWRLAAEQGQTQEKVQAQAQAQYNLGWAYNKGEGVTQDSKEAIRWYRLAAEQGNAKAKYQLAKIYLFPFDESQQDIAKSKQLANELILAKNPLGFKLQDMIRTQTSSPPTNTQLSMLQSLNAAKKGHPDKAIFNFSSKADVIQLPNKYHLAWRSFMTQKDEDYEDDLTKMSITEIDEIKNMRFLDLVSYTEQFIFNRQKAIGNVESHDLINEGWYQFLGVRGIINEPLAQYLTEEGLRLALYTNDAVAISTARNNLGVILIGAANTETRNLRLGLVHLLDGVESRKGPNNILWREYEGSIILTQKQLKELHARYKDKEGKPHVTTLLISIPKEIKENPSRTLDFLIQQFNTEHNIDVASHIANYIENNVGTLDQKIALIWHEKRIASQGATSENLLALARLKKIIAGKFVKGIPTMKNSIDLLFGNDLPTIDVESTDQILPNKSEATGIGHDKKLYALVIGNSSYVKNTLPNAINDATGIAKKLHSYGFNVTSLENLNRKDFVRALTEFQKKAENSDVTVLYYAGHGMQLGGLNYLLPTDIDFNEGEEVVTHDGVSLNEVLRINLPGKSRVIFLDACRDKPFKSNKTRGGSGAGLASMNVANGTLISFATKDGGVAYDGINGVNSPYTQALLKNLDQNEDVALILRDVREDVVASTNGLQEPWEYGALLKGKLILSRLNRQQPGSGQ